MLFKNLALALFVAAVVLSAWSCTPAPDATPRITALEGEVTINGAPAKKGQAVPDGAAVKTGEASACEVLFREKNILRLGEKSDAVLSLTKPGREASLRAGDMALVIKYLEDTGKKGKVPFTLKTPLASVFVRGTVLFAKIESPDSVYVCACNGLVTVADNGGTWRKKLEASHHQALTVVRGPSGVQAGKAPLLHHEDCATEALAERAGYMLNWNVVDKDIH